MQVAAGLRALAPSEAKRGIAAGLPAVAPSEAKAWNYGGLARRSAERGEACEARRRE
jgi:hypothetical protein